MKIKKSTLIGLVGGVILLGFLIYPRFKSEDRALAGIPCLISNRPLVQHIHPELIIIVDSQEEIIPKNIGMVGCESVIHTHDDTGEIHIEAQDRREYTLGDFFRVWGKKIDRDGYELKITVDGQPNDNFQNLIFRDNQKIIIKYNRLPQDL